MDWELRRPGDRFSGRRFATRRNVGAFVDAAAEALGGLDVLANNAAVTGAAAIAKLADITPEHFEQVVRVNLGGVLFVRRPPCLICGAQVAA